MRKGMVNNLCVAIDDINPKKGWRILGDKSEKILFDLNKEYGIKFTLFIPTFHHKTDRISDNKEWINELKNSGIFELAAHGHYHETSDPERLYECEFLEVDSNSKAEDRIKAIMEEWDKVEHKPLGWKYPGWLSHPSSQNAIENNFDYISVHYHHNANISWKNKPIYGNDSVHENKVSLHNDNFMFTSHIFGEWNKNTWDDKVADNFRRILDYIYTNYDINPIFIKDLL